MYLEVCRKKRNIIEYDSPGSVSEADAAELVKFVVVFVLVITTKRFWGP